MTRLLVRRARVLGAPVDLVTTPCVLDFVRQRVRTRIPARIATVNVEYIMRAQADPQFLRLLEGVDLATPDSAGVLWALRRQGVQLPYRVGGSDLIWSLCLQAAEFGHRVFFLGGEPGVADQAAARLRQAYPGLCVAGTHSGSPAPEEEANIVHLVRRSRTDVLFVAFGSPRQDQWIARNLAATGASCALAVGGSLDYVAGTTRRAPVWMRKNNLDWLWRLTRQPSRWRRMLVLPRFVALIVLDGLVHGGAERGGR